MYPDCTVSPLNRRLKLAALATPPLIVCLAACHGGDLLSTRVAQGPAGDVPRLVVTNVTFSQISAGGDRTCALAADGTPYCWGSGVQGEIPLAGSTIDSPLPLQVTSSRFVSISVGYVHSCAVASDSTAYCWGNDQAGELGIGSTVYQPLPGAPVAGGQRFATVSAGDFSTCGVGRAGAGFCWGGNVGSGNPRLSSPSPVAVAPGLTFKAMTLTTGDPGLGGGSGGQHTCGLTATGVAYCWGINNLGELGSGAVTTLDSVPVPVAGGIAFAMLSAGNYHTCGVSTDGAAYCWGSNYAGELGNPSVSDSSLVPIAVTGGYQFLTVSAGFFHTCGLTTDGSAYCWGANSEGQLGDGTLSERKVPAPVVGGLHFVAIAVGMAHSCALTAAGTAYCWGATSCGTGPPPAQYNCDQLALQEGGGVRAFLHRLLGALESPRAVFMKTNRS